MSTFRHTHVNFAFLSLKNLILHAMNQRRRKEQRQKQQRQQQQNHQLG